MILIHDGTSMARALALDLPPGLAALIRRRANDLAELLDWTEFLVVTAGDREADIVREVGFSPLVEPVDGARFGEPGFRPFWDHLVDHGGWFELSISFGSTFAYILLIQDAAGVLPDLLDLCRRHAAA